MASQSVLELAVSTGKWESGLRKAQSALSNFIEANGGLQQALGKDSEKMQKFVQMMGSMDSTAKTAKQQLREISNVLTDFTVTYRQLTDEQKASPFGQELAKSIQTLNERAGVLRDAMDDVQKSIKNASSDTRAFDQLAQGMSVATAGFQGLTGAGKLLGIEMGNDVEVIAKLQAAMAVTNSLTTIQTALQEESALMQGINTVQTKAAAIAQALLAKNTATATAAAKAFNLVAKASPIGLVITALGIAAAAYATFSDSADNAASSQDKLNGSLDKALGKVREINRQYEILQGYLSEIGGQSNWDKLQSENDVILRQIQELEARREELLRPNAPGNSRERNWWGIAADALTFSSASHVPALQGALTKTKLSDENLNAISEIDEQLEELRGRLPKIVNSMTSLRQAHLLFEREWQAITDPRQVRAAISYYEDKIKNLPNTADYDKLSADYQNRVDELKKRLRTPSTTGGGKGGGGSTTTVEQSEIFPEGSLKSLTAEMQELQKAQQLVTSTAEWRTYELAIEDVRNQIKELKGELGIDALRNVKGFSISDIVSVPTRKSILKKGDAAIRNFKLPEQTKNEVKLTDTMSQMNSGISSMVSGIEGLGIELPQGMKDMLGGIQAVTSILTGISTILSAIEAISAADTIIPFASGGVVKAASGYRVPGRTFSGDMIPARLNAGETVLNQAQAGVIASALQDREFGGGSGLMQPYVDGESIFLGMNNTSKRMGRGEIVTTSTLRRLGLT